MEQEEQEERSIETLQHSNVELNEFYYCDKIVSLVLYVYCSSLFGFFVSIDNDCGAYLSPKITILCCVYRAEHWKWLNLLINFSNETCFSNTCFKTSEHLIGQMFNIHIYYEYSWMKESVAYFIIMTYRWYFCLWFPLKKKKKTIIIKQTINGGCPWPMR